MSVQIYGRAVCPQFILLYVFMQLHGIFFSGRTDEDDIGVHFFELAFFVDRIQLVYTMQYMHQFYDNKYQPAHRQTGHQGSLAIAAAVFIERLFRHRLQLMVE